MNDTDTISTAKHERIDWLIASELKRLAVPPNLLGYRYIIDAVKIALDDHDALDSITKVLYPTVALMNNTTWERVERAIRHAVESSCMCAPAAVLRETFGNVISAHSGKVTNGCFIAVLVERIKFGE